MTDAQTSRAVDSLDSSPNSHRRRPAGSMPAFAPLYVPGTEEVSVRWLSVTYPLSPNVVDSVLPRPLTTPDAPGAIIWIAEFHDARFTDSAGRVETRPPYMQGGVNLKCQHDGIPGAYAVETFVEGLNHGILGREMFGLPKKQVTQVSLENTRSGVHFGIVDAHGRRILSGSALDETNAGQLAPEWFGTQFTAKLIPRADGPGYDVRKLVRIPFHLGAPGPLRGGHSEIEWHPSPSDPLDLLAPTGPVRAAWGEAELAIDYGTYVADLNPDELPVYGTPSW
ncbi:acetoacetate decarboxylase family protein [Streptomyces sp. NPDC007164]|uniref:acetoacetate decarboxylase family protein n=1 Tax=Streptomyces sp. NPDC007164 TaxID=3156918 RepID=UPI0033E03595